MGTRNDLKQLQRIAFGGALVSKSGDVIGHANNPAALANDIGGFAGIGIAGAVGSKAFDMALGTRRIRRVKYRKKRK